ncbi:MAG: hypothetical protein O7E52_09490, partial [Candidatus Poribacteria bacterium]|nr:hypothetical protein [Candidatus Poribacteria bacterium]
RVGRSGLLDLLDYNLLNLPSLRPFSRVILIVTFNATPRVLMDGIITHQELQPSNEPGDSILTVTGEDVSVMMDMEEKSVEHPAQDETVIANKIIAGYAQYGLIPTVIPPTVVDPPIPIERTPGQQETDLSYLNHMAARFGYVFYVTPGPLPMTNAAYWGPPKRLNIPQKALSVNMGSHTNVESINFQHDALAPTFVSGQLQDRLTNQSLPVETFASTRVPLASQPTWLVHYSNVRQTQLRKSGLNTMQAFARAQGKMDASMDEVVTATGALDALSYGGLLQARGLVGLRGVGYTYDGIYYVKKVTHKISKGEYKQDFTLTREGVGSITPVVRP